MTVKKFMMFCLLTATLTAFVLGSCVQPAPAPAPKPSPAPAPSPVPKKEVMLDLWTSPFGGTAYVAGFAFMDTLNKTHPWLRSSIIESKGSVDNLLNSDKDRAKLPTILSYTDYCSLINAANGTSKPWNDAKKPPALPGDRLIIGTYGASAQLMVTFNPAIKRGKDLVDKKMAGWTRGSGAFDTLQVMFEAWGITEKDLKSYDGMELKAKNDALSDGLVDAIQLSEPFLPDKPGLCSSSLSELLSNPKQLYNVPITKEEAQAAEAKYKERKQCFQPWMKLPAGHYNKNWSEGGAIFVLMVIWAYKEMPEDIQYEIAKTMIEKSDDIAAHGGQSAVLLPSVVVGALPIEKESEMAPGALKYYKEKGIWSKYPPPFLKK